MRHNCSRNVVGFLSFLLTNRAVILVFAYPTHQRADHGCVPDCNSKIFCSGRLLHDIQMARIYPDSKSFVDKALRFSEAQVLSNYSSLLASKNGKTLTKHELIDFINTHFEDGGIEKWSPPDFKEKPSLLANIKDDKLKQWALNLNEIWKDLGLRAAESVRDYPDRYSLLYTPNGFMIAGTRFTEMYYWDSYWMIRGLLLCDMRGTAKGIISNMLYLIKKYGHMPNASRKYYLQRSQPPLLIQMAATYHNVTNDDDFIRDNLKDFEKEFNWWDTNRMVTFTKDGKVYRMARYAASTSCTPRPEAYHEDFTLAQQLNSTANQSLLYTNIKAAAESGWDFSSRHFVTFNGTNNGGMINMGTMDLIFVDLNCILHANALVLSEWFRYFKNERKARYYNDIADKLKTAIEEVLWDEKVGIWLDYDYKRRIRRNYFYPSNLTPLWTGSYNKKKRVMYAEKAIAYLIENKMIRYDGEPNYYGVPTSIHNTTEQWDFPNCWAPLQSFVIQGLDDTGHPVARYIAYKLAEKWIQTNHAGFISEGFMYEKYSAVSLGETGEGGEYVPQTGFGWTNGFALEILNTWGNYLHSDNFTPIQTVPTTVYSFKLPIQPNVLQYGETRDKLMGKRKYQNNEANQTYEDTGPEQEWTAFPRTTYESPGWDIPTDSEVSQKFDVQVAPSYELLGNSNKMHFPESEKGIPPTQTIHLGTTEIFDTAVDQEFRIQQHEESGSTSFLAQSTQSHPVINAY